MDFDCGSLNENELAGLNIAEKKIYLNEVRADELNANVGLKNFTIAHELGHWVLHRNFVDERNQQYLLMPEEFVREAFAKINSVRLLSCLPIDSIIGKIQSSSGNF